MSKLLNALGLMKRSEHERWLEQSFDAMDAERERFKLAATDLAKQAEEIEAYGEALSNSADTIKALKIRLHYAEPRAQKWDNSLKRSRDRKAARKGVGS